MGDDACRHRFLLRQKPKTPVRSANCRWFPARTRRLVRRYLVVVGQRDVDIVESLEQPPPGVVVDVEGVLDRVRTLACLDGSRLEVDGDSRTGLVLEVVPQPLHDLL